MGLGSTRGRGPQSRGGSPPSQDEGECNSTAQKSLWERVEHSTASMKRLLPAHIHHPPLSCVLLLPSLLLGKRQRCRLHFKLHHTTSTVTINLVILLLPCQVTAIPMFAFCSLPDIGSCASLAASGCAVIQQKQGETPGQREGQEGHA